MLWDWLTSGHDILTDLPALVLRTLMGFVALLAIMRLTGKRTVTQLAPFDFAVVVLVGELAAIPIADDRLDIFHGLIPVLIIGLLHIALSRLNLRFGSLEELTEGKSTPLIKDGKVLKQNLRKERVSKRDLLAALRLQKVKRMQDIRDARLEHSGGISVILHDAAEPLKFGDGLSPRMREELDRLLASHLAKLRADLLAELRSETKDDLDAGDAPIS